MATNDTRIDLLQVQQPAAANRAALLDAEGLALAGLGLGLVGFFIVREFAATYAPERIAPFFELFWLALVGYCVMLYSPASRNSHWSFASLFSVRMMWLLFGGCMLTSGYGNFSGFVFLVLLAPVVEELYFRESLMRLLAGSMGHWLAILLTTALFVFMHGAGGLDVIWQAAVLSIACCLVMYLPGGLLWAIGLHTVWNGYAVLAANEIEFDMVPMPHLIIIVIYAIGLVSTSYVWSNRARNRAD